MVPFCHSWSQLVLPTLSFLTLCAHICFSIPVVAKRGTGINSFNAFTVWSVDVVPACLSLELWCYGARPGTPLAGTKSMRQGLWTALNCHLPMSRLFYVLSLLCFPLKPEDLAYDYPSLRDVWRIKKLMQLQAKVSQTDTRLITLNWEPKEFQNNVLNIRSVACLTVIVLKQIDLCSLPKASTWLKKHSISFPGSFSFQRWPLLSLFSPFHNFYRNKRKAKEVSHMSF